MDISILKLYLILKEKFGEEQAQYLAEFVESEVEKQLQTKKNSLAKKKDVTASKTDMIKWMFIFWIGQVAATIAIVKLFI